MAANLLAHQHTLIVYNHTCAKAEPLLAQAGRYPGSDPGDADAFQQELEAKK